MIEDVLIRLEKAHKLGWAIPLCRCCGKNLGIMDGISDAWRDGGVGIHTLCIFKHRSKHKKGKNKSKCVEFKEVKS